MASYRYDCSEVGFCVILSIIPSLIKSLTYNFVTPCFSTSSLQ